MHRGGVLICMVLLAGALGLLGCNGANDVTGADTGPAGNVAAYISSLSVDGLQATYRPGDPPAEGVGPDVTVETHATVINGGSSLVRLESSEDLARIVVCVPGVPGYWDLELPPASRGRSVTAILGVAQSIPVDRFDTQFAGGTTTDVMGPQTTRSLSVVPVGTGDLQISLSWDKRSDLDLHVVEPSGEEIYHQQLESATGGTLDLDSNRACVLDDINNENVTWPAGQAPSGTYVVRVDNWDSCGEEPIDYVVTVIIGGVAQPTHSGTFTGPGDNGSLGSGIFVTTVDL